MQYVQNSNQKQVKEVIPPSSEIARAYLIRIITSELTKQSAVIFDQMSLQQKKNLLLAAEYETEKLERLLQGKPYEMD